MSDLRDALRKESRTTCYTVNLGGFDASAFVRASDSAIRGWLGLPVSHNVCQIIACKNWSALAVAFLHRKENFISLYRLICTESIDKICVKYGIT